MLDALKNKIPPKKFTDNDTDASKCCECCKCRQGAFTSTNFHKRRGYILFPHSKMQLLIATFTVCVIHTKEKGFFTII